jgi:NAD(P)-dependent dehydrogenase (short-subunit alcohol dehydrogenase family)
MTNALTTPGVLITGASSGIGRQAAIRLSAEHSLILSGRNVAELERTRAECARPNDCRIWAYDLTRPAEIAASLEAIVQQAGGVAGYVHCAGVLAVRPLRLETLETAVEAMNVNVFSAIEISRNLISQRVNGRSLKSVVFVSSIASLYGAKGHAVYASSKGALDGLMRAMAVELAPHVRVNSVLPGAVPTTMTAGVFADRELAERMAQQYPLGLGSPDDIADAIEFLMSARAKWITGQQLIVDGGRTVNITA